jgi:nitroreductase
MEFQKLIKDRYSVRSFRPEPLPREVVEQILAAGHLAPTGCNYQPQRILVLQGEGMDQLQKCTPCCYGAPAALIVCYDKTVSWKSRSGREIGDVDGTIVITQMMYQAEELGIGSLLVGMYKEPLLRESFRIPANYEIVCLLMLGYPADDSQPHPQLHDQRYPLEETVFYGTF